MSDKNDIKDAKKHKKEKAEKRKFRRIRETWSELKKVTWPSAGTIVKSTGVVLLVVAMFLAVLLIFDIILRVFAFNPLVEGKPGNPFGINEESLKSFVSLGKQAINTLKSTVNYTFGRSLWL